MSVTNYNIILHIYNLYFVILCPAHLSESIPSGYFQDACPFPLRGEQDCQRMEAGNHLLLNKWRMYVNINARQYSLKQIYAGR